MLVGIITGSGTYALRGFEGTQEQAVRTPFGEATVVQGELNGVEVLHVSRHGPGHARLSNHVEHRANVWALKEMGSQAVIGCTACGAVDPGLELGSLVVFDDLHFLSNRLPDGSLCTFFDQPGDPHRAHWILHGGPYSEALRGALLAAAVAAGTRPAEAGAVEPPARDGGTYGHVDGPRFNTPAEIAQLAAAGVVAVSQTGGPETVLCGEAGLPYALLGFITDYANEVVPGPAKPVAELVALMGRSTAVFAEVLRGAVARLAGSSPRAAGTMLRLGLE